MGLTSAVHWWEEKQMRVLVLTSLVIQFLLCIFTRLRNRAIPGIRFLLWLAYLGGDAIAIYALATLFNRHKDDQGGGGGSSRRLEVVWAPILLIHLGGHDGITAYNIEDNELWSRQLLTAVSQVTVAIYVFCKSWQGGDKRLLQAAIILFIPGVLKCFAKPWALKRASIKSLVSSTSAQNITEKAKKDMKRLEEYVQRRGKASVREKEDEGEAQGQGTTTCVEDRDNPIPVPPPQRGSGGEQNEREMEAFMFEWYVNGAMDFVRQHDGEAAAQDYPKAPVEDRDHVSSPQDHRQVKQRELDPINKILHGEACKLFVDLSSPYLLRLSIFGSFWTLSEERIEEAYDSVRAGLATAFILLYTKVKVSVLAMIRDSKFGQRGEARLTSSSLLILRSLFVNFVAISRLYLPWAAIGVFHHSHREAYSGIDVKITYALFCYTAVLEVYSGTLMGRLKEHIVDECPEMVAQYNLTEYFVRNKNHSNMMWIARKSGCKDFLDQQWCMKSCSSSGTIVKLVLQYLKDGWKEKINDPISYRKFNDNRGQWALERYEEKLGWSIKGPFDKSVLLWHIATDICFFWKTPPDNNQAVQCRQMSNYMMYLLFVNPEMLLPGTRRNLFTTAYDELKDILRDINLNPQSCCCCCQKVEENGVMKALIDTMQKRDRSNKENFINKAWDLAQELLNMGDDNMWKVIRRVWVEMLCFSAGRCRGHLHAKALGLGTGGEFLSYVWLLMFYMGMETFTERLQREELPNQEANNNVAPWTSDADNGNSTTSSPSGIRSRGASSPYRLHNDVSTSNSRIPIVDIV